MTFAPKVNSEMLSMIECSVTRAALATIVQDKDAFGWIKVSSDWKFFIALGQIVLPRGYQREKHLQTTVCKCFFDWRLVRDSNPCRRRERAVS